MFLIEINRYLNILPVCGFKNYDAKNYLLALEFFEPHGGEFEGLTLVIEFKDVQALHWPTTWCYGPFILKVATLNEAGKLIPPDRFSFEDFKLEERKCFYMLKAGEILEYYIDALSLEAKTVPEVWKGASVPTA